MSISYFGQTSNPVDNGTHAGYQVSCTPPASMQLGDLCLMYVHYRGTGVSLNITNDGGQTWNEQHQEDNGIGVRTGLWWCTFDGTWDSDPQVDRGTSGTNASTMVLTVFRPTDTWWYWALDKAGLHPNYGAPSSPFDVYHQSITTGVENALVIQGGCSTDVNTWAVQTGGWTQIGTQIRNNGGSYASAYIGYKVQASPGTTGSSNWRQTANGGDNGMYYHFSLYEVEGTPPSGGAVVDPMGMMGFFGA